MTNRLPLPSHDWDIKRGPDWPERRKWLLSLGLTDTSIRCYRLDRYPYMDSDCWDIMVKEALRHHTVLHNEQMRRKQTHVRKSDSKRPSTRA